ncbi:hypothetical protein PInf_024542 [Phytophthora infestans]|nr:hypothetical protein PInf_024542 [Phytophthora infestans]
MLDLEWNDYKNRSVPDVPHSTKEVVRATRSYYSNTRALMRLADYAKHDNYVRPLYWAIRFTVWIAKKRTPAMMYNKLNVISSTGIGDRNYRIYINYVRLYEYFKGPTYNPLLVHGPKFDT